MRFVLSVSKTSSYEERKEFSYFNFIPLMVSSPSSQLSNKSEKVSKRILICHMKSLMWIQLGNVFCLATYLVSGYAYFPDTLEASVEATYNVIFPCTRRVTAYLERDVEMRRLHG